MVACTIPAGVLSFFFHHQMDVNLQRPVIIGTALIGVGLLMGWADVKARLTRQLESSNFSDAVSIGIAQAFALLPGVSRSGITITTGLFRGMTRDAATRFSFLLSAPVIAGAVAKELPKLIKLHHAGGLEPPPSTLSPRIPAPG